MSEGALSRILITCFWVSHGHKRDTCSLHSTRSLFPCVRTKLFSTLFDLVTVFDLVSATSFCDSCLSIWICLLARWFPGLTFCLVSDHVFACCVCKINLRMNCNTSSSGKSLQDTLPPMNPADLCAIIISQGAIICTCQEQVAEHQNANQQLQSTAPVPTSHGETLRMATGRHSIGLPPCGIATLKSKLQLIISLVWFRRCLNTQSRDGKDISVLEPSWIYFLSLPES